MKGSQSKATKNISDFHPEDYEKCLENLSDAQREYATFTQKQVDKIFRAASIAANGARVLLAREAITETGRGILEDKVLKNHFASEYIYNFYRNRKTCGIIKEDPQGGIAYAASPAGPILGITPVTNPTSTVIFKSLLGLKTGNGIIFCPHPSAKRSSIHAAQIVLDAAVKAGAPPGIISWVSNPTVQLSKYLMSHQSIKLILATGGPAMVKTAYSSGTPAVGVGPGNVPSIVDELADIEKAVHALMHSKNFDHGMVCASEQTVIVVKSVYKRFVNSMRASGACILDPQEKEKVGRLLIKDGRLNPDIVGKSARTIAEMAGIQIPEYIRLLIGEIDEIGPNEPFSFEKLSPVLALMQASNFDEALDIAQKVLEFGGEGHTASIFTSESARDRINKAGIKLSVNRILINSPSSQAAIGDIYNFAGTPPSLTLGCGTQGGNSTPFNVGIDHLMNIKTISIIRKNMLWLKIPEQIYFKRASLSEALKDIEARKKAFIITDKMIYSLGYVKRLTDVLDQYQIDYKIFSAIKPDPDLSTIENALKDIRDFEPDTIIALGGGSPIDAGKMIWLLYEHPEFSFHELALRFMDIRKRICRFPKLQKCIYIAIPTTSGTGSEVTPFAVITDDKTGIKYPIADYVITPSMAIVDPDFIMQMPKSLIASSGYDAISHAVEALTATTATDFTEPYALKALDMLFAYLVRSYRNDQFAREKVHYAATIAGIAFANAFLGINHSMAHKIGSAFHIPHGIANAILLPIVVQYNADQSMTKLGTFPQYSSPASLGRYAKAADMLQLGGKNEKEKVENLVKALVQLRSDLDIPATIRDFGVDEKDFLSKVDSIAEMAFDDQCTSTNPRYPTISEIRDLLMAAYYKGE